MEIGDYVKVNDDELKYKYPYAYKVKGFWNDYTMLNANGDTICIKNYLLEVVSNPFQADSYDKSFLKDCCEALKYEHMKDEVNHPEHYTAGKYETIDIIKDSVDDYKSYVHGNIIKYILRYKKKGGVQDLKKAQVYLNWLIQEEEY